MIENLHLQGFRSLRDVTLEFKPLTVLVGRNDSGKTNVLDALLVLSHLANSGSSSLWSPPLGQFVENCWARSPARMELRATGDTAGAPWTYGVTLEPSSAEGETGHPAAEIADGPWGSITWQRGGPRVLARGGAALANLDEREGGATKPLWDLDVSRVAWTDASRKGLRETPEQRDEGRKRMDAARKHLFGVRDWLRQVTGGWRKYALRPEAVRLRSRPVVNRNPEVGNDGSGVPAVIDFWHREDRERFGRIETALALFAPAVKAIIPREDVEPPRGGGEGLVAWKRLAFRVEKPGCVLDIERVSDGIVLVLAWLTIANLPNAPRLIVVEEPENGVHPHSLGMVIDVLRDLALGRVEGVPACQIVLATHSPFVVDCLKLDGTDELIVLGRDADGATQAAMVSGKPWIRRLVPPYLLGEAWVNFGDEGLMADQQPAERAE